LVLLVDPEAILDRTNLLACRRVSMTIPGRKGKEQGQYVLEELRLQNL
jgi:hypothetical protein